MKKRLFLVAVIAALWMVSPAVGSTSDWLAGCTVNSVGAGADTYYHYVPIQMTCPGFPLKNYNIKGSDMSAKNRVLATFLTALSTEKTVMVRVDDKNADPAVVDIVLVQK